MGRWQRWALAVGVVGLLAPGACTSGPGLEPPVLDNAGGGGTGGAGDMFGNMGGGAVGGTSNLDGTPRTPGAGGATGGPAVPPAAGNEDSNSADAGVRDDDAGLDPDAGVP